MFSFMKALRSRHTRGAQLKKGRQQQHKRSSRAPLQMELLEGRLVPANIVWVNRGDDNFNSLVMLGTTPNVAKARQVVDTAISYWSQVIQDFHWDDEDITQFDLTIEVENMDDYRASTSGDHDDGDDTPYAATITLDYDADGSGWWVDPSPRDNSEFLGNVAERDVAFGDFNGNDMLRTVMHEIGHAVGFSESADGFEADDLKIGDYLEDTDLEDDKGGSIAVFAAGSVRASFSDEDGLHLLEKNVTYEDHVYFGGEDLMNPGRASDDWERKLISDFDAKILQAAYGYTVKLPSTILGLSYLANLTPGGTLSIHNDPDTNVENVSLVRQGGQRIINVNGTIIDVPSLVIPSVKVHGTDNFHHLRLDFSGGDLVSIGGSLTYYGGGDHDQLTIKGTAGKVFTLSGNFLTVTGGGVSDTIQLVDVEDLVFETTGDCSITIQSTPAGLEQITVTGGSGRDNVTVQKVSDGVDLLLNAGQGNDNVRIYSIPANSLFLVRGGLGTDQIVVGNATYSLSEIDGELQVFGDGGSGDALILKDYGLSIGQSFGVRDTGLTRTGMGTITWAYTSASSSGFESIMVQAGSGNDTFTIHSQPKGVSTILSAGNGADTLIGNDASSIFLPNIWTLTHPNKGTFNGFTFAAMENLRGCAGGDLFSIKPNGSLAGTLDGGLGSNALDYTSWTGNVYVNLATGAASQVTGGVLNVSQVIGGAGSDLLVGNSAANSLYGGLGRDILIGGVGADFLRGGADEDLLINGKTSYDLKPASLQAIANAWRVVYQPYTGRVNTLKTGVGSGGTVKLSTTTVTNDGQLDDLKGEVGRDWFWAILAEIGDKASNEVLGAS